MSDFDDVDMDACGCCEAGTAADPDAIRNAPGLSTLHYRAATHPEFLRRMLAALPRTTVGEDGARPLAGLTARTPDDPAIALLDAWATVADVLTFYQERIANEGFLRTATERRSVLELARAIGYELRPGVAASTFLAFTVDATPGAPGNATIPEGTKVQSIPAKGGLPQTFETSETLEGRAVWNALKPRLRQPQPIDPAAPVIFLDGTVTDLKPGDLVLFVTNKDGKADAIQKRVVAVTPEAALTRTRVDIENAERDAPEYVFVAKTYATATLLLTPLINANVQSYVIGNQWKEEELSAFATMQGWNTESLEHTVISAQPAAPTYAPKADTDPLPPAQVGVYGFKFRVAPFGNNAPMWASLPVDQRVAAQGAPAGDPPYKTSWDTSPGHPITTDSAGTEYKDPSFFLERTVPEITEGSWVVLERSGGFGRYRVVRTLDRSLADFALSARVTGLTVQDPAGGPPDFANFMMRSTTIHAGSRALPLVDLPIDAPFGQGTAEASQLTLDTMVLGLSKGRPVVITGERADLAGVVVSEAVVLADIVHSDGLTTLFFTTELVNTYVRKTATISANVARATHGETITEVLGGGDTSQPNQGFALKRPPLTYVAGGPGGASTTLKVRVNDILWAEAASLYEEGPRDEAYMVRIDDDHVATVRFGDGVRGARPATGSENITATYRTGIGLAGQVSSDSLTLLQTRPPGVRGVTNPVAASGAAEPEVLADARTNAPLTVLAMGRIVSLRDYEDFAAGFAGVGKAQAVELTRGETSFVHITIAASDGTPVSPTSDLYLALVKEVAAESDPIRHFEVDSFQPLFVHLIATIRIDRRYRSDAVIAAAKDAVRAAFSFSRRGFGQPITAAEVVTSIQMVAGVESVDLDSLFRVDDATSPPPATLATIVPAERAHLVGSGAVPGQLLVVNPFGIVITDASQP